MLLVLRHAHLGTGALRVVTCPETQPAPVRVGAVKAASGGETDRNVSDGYLAETRRQKADRALDRSWERGPGGGYVPKEEGTEAGAADSYLKPSFRALARSEVGQGRARSDFAGVLALDSRCALAAAK